MYISVCISVNVNNLVRSWKPLRRTTMSLLAQQKGRHTIKHKRSFCLGNAAAKDYNSRGPCRLL